MPGLIGSDRGDLSVPKLRRREVDDRRLVGAIAVCRTLRGSIWTSYRRCRDRAPWCARAQSARREQAKSAYVDNKAPGRVVSGTISRGNRFKIHRIARVTHGSAKGLWYLGTATVTGEHAKNSKGEIRPFKITGWVKASAFA